jgi:hypothetical protein
MDESIYKPQLTAGLETVPNADPALRSPGANSSYLKIINNARKVVAILMAVCGIGVVVCVNRDNYLTETLRREAGIWAWGKWAFGIGVLICLIATLTFIIEYLARPAAPKSITFRSLFIRSMFIIIVIAVVFYSMDIFCGLAQGIGATIGTFLLLAALKKDNPTRAVLAVLAVIVLGPTLLSTQSAYQYARRHADEIVAAGCELMDQYPETHYIEKASLSDQHLPTAIRKLGVYSIKIDKESVSILVPGIPFIPGFPDREFHIFRNPTTQSDPVWAHYGKGAGTFVITDRLWMFEDD